MGVRHAGLSFRVSTVRGTRLASLFGYTRKRHPAVVATVRFPPQSLPPRAGYLGSAIVREERRRGGARLTSSGRAIMYYEIAYHVGLAARPAETRSTRARKYGRAERARRAKLDVIALMTKYGEFYYRSRRCREDAYLASDVCMHMYICNRERLYFRDLFKSFLFKSLMQYA